jgi:hypothetical protein
MTQVRVTILIVDIKMPNTGKAKDFDFKSMVSNWGGYVSSIDKTNIAENLLVQGSQNVYKKLSGTISVREGLKRRGLADSTASPCYSEFPWLNSRGETYTMVVSNSTLWVVIDEVWYALQTGLTKTRYVFDKWWNVTLNQDFLLFVNGTTNLFSWSGGFAEVGAATINTITKTGTTTFKEEGFVDTTFTTIGSSSSQFDITNPSGTTFRYTWDGTGTDPAITATSIPIGSYILIGAQNFNAANNGIFVVTGAGTNYFEVTNASGVAENNKTIGTGYIYKKYTKVLIINGNIFAYTGGESTTILTGVVPDASGLANGDIILQAVMTYSNTPTSTFFSDFIKVINNQLYMGSYTSLNIFMSQNTDFTNFVVPSPQLDGSPGLFVMPSVAKGIGVRQGNAWVGAGSDNWVEISFTLQSNNSIITRTNRIDIKPVARMQAPLAHEFIDTVGDIIVYLAQDHQVRAVGDFNTLFVTGYPSLSQEVATELEQEVFTGGGLKTIGEFIYLTAPNSGKVYLRQERTRVDPSGVLVAERLWHAPFIWNATFIDAIEGEVVVFSNANPQIYDAWGTGQWYDDSPSDEQIPYTCIMALGYRGESRRQGLWSFDKNFSEGYIVPETELNCRMNYNYQGSTNVIDMIINSPTQPVKTFSAAVGSLGDSILGESSLGEGGIDDDDSLPKFKCINSLAIINCFEWQPIFFSENAGARWEIIATGTNATVESEQDATFIINRNRL